MKYINFNNAGSSKPLDVVNKEINSFLEIEKNYGGYLLSNAIKISFKKEINRVWVHTCTLDHKNALKNYLARGMKIFKEEKINISA